MTWKILTTKEKLLKEVLLDKKKKNFIIYNKSIQISPLFLDRKFKIHNGKNFFNIRIKTEHIGNVFGEFCFTRKVFDKGFNSKFRKIRKRRTKKKPTKLRLNSKLSLKAQMRGKQKNLLSEKRYKLRTIKTIKFF